MADLSMRWPPAPWGRARADSRRCRRVSPTRLDSNRARAGARRAHRRRPRRTRARRPSSHRPAVEPRRSDRRPRRHLEPGAGDPAARPPLVARPLDRPRIAADDRPVQAAEPDRPDRSPTQGAGGLPSTTDRHASPIERLNCPTVDRVLDPTVDRRSPPVRPHRRGSDRGGPGRAADRTDPGGAADGPSASGGARRGRSLRASRCPPR